MSSIRLSKIRQVTIDIRPVAWTESYSVRIDVQGTHARYCREQLIPSSRFGSDFDLFMSDAIESIREELENDGNLQAGVPTS